MDDRTLIERAAKAAGLKEHGWMGGTYCHVVDNQFVFWRPLTDDGDNARLEADCEIEIEWCRLGVIAKKQTPSALNDVNVRVLYADHNGDKQKARRYASTRAAASLAMGEWMEHVYHFCVSYQKEVGQVGYYDGVLLRDRAINTADEYMSAKTSIAKHSGFPADRIVVLALNRLSESQP